MGIIIGLFVATIALCAAGDCKYKEGDLVSVLDGGVWYEDGEVTDVNVNKQYFTVKYNRAREKSGVAKMRLPWQYSWESNILKSRAAARFQVGDSVLLTLDNKSPRKCLCCRDKPKHPVGLWKGKLLSLTDESTKRLRRNERKRKKRMTRKGWRGDKETDEEGRKTYYHKKTGERQTVD